MPFNGVARDAMDEQENPFAAVRRSNKLRSDTDRVIQSKDYDPPANTYRRG